MGLFRDQFLSVIEWNETDEKQMFHKFGQDEIKNGSKLIIRPGQNAIFLNSGTVDGVFKAAGNYDIDTDIIPVLSTLKGFKFGLDSGMRAEVLFINVKEFNERWGTKQPVVLQTPMLPGGMPIRANGGFQFKIDDYQVFIDKIAGIKDKYTTDDIKTRAMSLLDQLLMSHIATEGKDLFNIQASAAEISKGIQADLDAEFKQIGLAVTGFQINSVSYPKEVQEMQNKAAGQAMVGDMAKYTQMAAADAMSAGDTGTGQMAGAMMGVQMGAVMAQQMAQQMNGGAQQMGTQVAPAQPAQPAQPSGAQTPQGQSAGGTIPNFCPNCGAKTTGTNFCPNCGFKLV
ncbi:MAG: SPFH domain-containing protein [Bacillota bacterium]|nr:SPFH domain-containing protein [Bacillota bacterium]